MGKTGHNISYAAVCEAFNARKVSDFTDDELSDFVDVLCDDGLRNDEHQVRASLRLSALNHARMERLIGRLNIQNGITATAVKRLTVLAVGLAALQVAGVAFFVWRDFHPRDIPIHKEAVTSEGQPNADPPKDEGSSPVKPLRE